MADLLEIYFVIGTVIIAGGFVWIIGICWPVFPVASRNGLQPQQSGRRQRKIIR